MTRPPARHRLPLTAAAVLAGLGAAAAGAQTAPQAGSQASPASGPAREAATAVPEAPPPVELAVTHDSPVTCQPDPLLLPGNAIVELTLVNRSVNSTVIALDPLLAEQPVLAESDLAQGAADAMEEGYMLGPGQSRQVIFATVEPGEFVYVCRSPAADDIAMDAPDLVFEGTIRVE